MLMKIVLIDDIFLVFSSKIWLNTREAMTFKPQEEKREKEGERGRERENERASERVCVCECVCDIHVYASHTYGTIKCLHCFCFTWILVFLDFLTQII
jgi:hypothetical protein